MPGTRLWFPDYQSSLYLAICVFGNLSILSILYLTHSIRPIIITTTLYIITLLLAYRHSGDSTLYHRFQTGIWYSDDSHDTRGSFGVLTVGIMGLLTTAIVSACSVIGAKRHGFENGIWESEEGMVGDVPFVVVITLGTVVLITLMPAFDGYVFW